MVMTNNQVSFRKNVPMNHNMCLISCIKHGPKEFWKVVKQAQRKTQKSKVGPIKDGNDNLLLDDTEKAKCFNDYFASIGEDLAEKYDEIREVNLQQYIVRVTPTTQEIQINQETVRERLDKKLNPK